MKQNMTFNKPSQNLTSLRTIKSELNFSSSCCFISLNDFHIEAAEMYNIFDDCDIEIFVAVFLFFFAGVC